MHAYRVTLTAVNYRNAGWQHHPVCNVRYHFIIPSAAALANPKQVFGAVEGAYPSATGTSGAALGQTADPAAAAGTRVSHGMPPPQLPPQPPPGPGGGLGTAPSTDHAAMTSPRQATVRLAFAHKVALLLPAIAAAAVA